MSVSKEVRSVKQTKETDKTDFGIIHDLSTKNRLTARLYRIFLTDGIEV